MSDDNRIKGERKLNEEIFDDTQQNMSSVIMK